MLAAVSLSYFPSFSCPNIPPSLVTSASHLKDVNLSTLFSQLLTSFSVPSFKNVFLSSLVYNFLILSFA